MGFTKKRRRRALSLLLYFRDMKIAFVISSLAMAGMEMRVARMAGLAQKRGHTIHFGCPRESPLRRELEAGGIRTFPLHIHGSLDLVAMGRLVRHLRRERIEVLMGFNGKDYWMTVAAAKLAGIPVLLNRSTANAMKQITVPVVRASDGVIAVSRGIADVLTAQGVPEKKVKVIHLGVNTAVFSPDRRRSRQELREEKKLPRDVLIAGCFGRSSKGQRQLLEADELLGGIRDNLHYFFAGDHVPERIGPFAAERPSLAGRVILRDPVPFGEVPDYLVCLDMVVMLPEREPFSNAVLEAMAMERPVVLSRTLGNIEAVEDGISGILTQHDDIPAIARHVGSLCKSEARRGEIGRAAGRRVRELFTEEVMMRRLEEEWNRVRPL
jgi:glycosyltransferase involved in cell wall biosynthesis